MSSPKIRLTKDKETYLATLYGKALDAASPNPILGDRYAAAAVDRLDVDFKALKLPDGGDITLPMRARHFDAWTRAFIRDHPSATVLHLGSGLDTRVQRIDPPPTARWYDVDMPDVIDLRARLYPARTNVHLIRSSVTDLAWLDSVTADQPVFVVAEGLMMYLPEAQGLALLQRITRQFPSGQIAFDAYSGSMVRLVSRLATVRGAQVELVWGIDDPRDLELQVPGLRLAEDVSFLTMPELVQRLAHNGFSRAMHGMLGRIGFYRRLVRHLLYAFG